MDRTSSRSGKFDVKCGLYLGEDGRAREELLGAKHALEDARLVVVGERRAADEQLVDEAAERPKVDGLVVALGVEDLKERAVARRGGGGRRGEQCAAGPRAAAATTTAAAAAGDEKGRQQAPVAMVIGSAPRRADRDDDGVWCVGVRSLRREDGPRWSRARRGVV